MTEIDPKQGQRFSLTYMSSPDLLPDSERMRRRVGHLIGEFSLEDFGQAVAKELGVPVSSPNAAYASYWPTFLEKARLRDVLDIVTLRYKFMSVGFQDSTGRFIAEARKKFLVNARRIFAEERVRYQIDDRGGVHFMIDAAFESGRIATVSQLGRTRYAGVRQLFDQAFEALDLTPPDGKAAIRGVFFAAENLFRLMYPGSAQLNAGEVMKNLKPQIDAHYAEQKPAIYVAQKQISAFKEWIDGAHFYRHEPGTEEPAQPPLDLAVYMISQGAAHIRWLVKHDPAN